jgi:hypothetical protein
MAGALAARSTVSGWGISGSDCLPRQIVRIMDEQDEGYVKLKLEADVLRAENERLALDMSNTVPCWITREEAGLATDDDDWDWVYAMCDRDEGHEGDHEFVREDEIGLVFRATTDLCRCSRLREGTCDNLWRSRPDWQRCRCVCHSANPEQDVVQVP